MQSRSTLICFAAAVFAAAGGSVGSAAANGWFHDRAPELQATESVSVEPFLGYLRGTSGESVYDPANPKSKVSQLDWTVNALAVGARVAARPFEHLSIRGRFWATVASDGGMADYDWFGGYFGKGSWTHKSDHPDTDLGKAWQADISAAFAYFAEDDVALTAIAGYRRYDVKYKARGGSYVYSTGGFRDTIGSFTPGQIGIAYEQSWDVPYFGLGANWNGDSWAVSAELIGSPFVTSRDRDYHALRTTLFKGDFDMSGMVGASLGVEYRFTQMVSLAGRFEYQRYLEAKGSTRIFEGTTGTALAIPKPSAGAEADTLLLSLGIKARL